MWLVLLVGLKIFCLMRFSVRVWMVLFVVIFIMWLVVM